MAEWFNMTERTPEPGETVLVKSEGWNTPRVLIFDTRLEYPRLIDRMSGRFFWYPEKMRWTHIPLDTPAASKGVE